MKLLDRIVGAFRRRAIGAEAVVVLDEARAMFMRAFGGANDDRTTKNHWGQATNNGINADLVHDLENLRNRIRFERQNNGYLEGIATSNEQDIVGAAGPALKVITTDVGFEQALEKIWKAWWSCPDFNGQMSGAEMLSQSERQRWDCGESLWQIVTDAQATGPVKTRLLAIHPRRLQTPYGFSVTKDTTLGVRRTETGRPLAYFIREDRDTELNFTIGFRYTEVPAAFIIHDYDVNEPGQARGVPALSCALNVVAQMRDWDKDVQQAMRMAAMLGMFFYSESPDAAPITLNGSIDLESGTGVALPPGYKPMQMAPQQPSQHYEAFRDAKLAEMGRPAAMPLMMVKLDSSGHNYSSARFDGQGYDRAVKVRQGRINRRKLDRLLALVMKEAQLARVLGATPADFAIQWVWPTRPHVDPTKESEGQRMRLEDGSQTQAGYCAEYGLDLDAVRTQRVKEGLPPGPTWMQPGAPPPTPVAGDAQAQAGATATGKTKGRA